LKSIGLKTAFIGLWMSRSEKMIAVYALVSLHKTWHQTHQTKSATKRYHQSECDILGVLCWTLSGWISTRRDWRTLFAD